MSLPGKEVRPQIGADSHEKLSIMADHGDHQINQFSARLLEKAIEYEWHEFKLTLARSERLGKRWKAVDEGGGR